MRGSGRAVVWARVHECCATGASTTTGSPRLLDDEVGLCASIANAKKFWWGTDYWPRISIFFIARTITPTTHRKNTKQLTNMAKRPADSEQEQEAIKNGDRPMEIDQDEAGEFEDEFEDEFESEDEIFEAGVDGRPDEEREAEERESES